ncbi:MAG: hypothetical protein ACPG30_08305 [Parvibaculales bacterium]
MNQSGMPIARKPWVKYATLALVTLFVSGCGSESEKKAQTPQTESALEMMNASETDNQKLYEMGACFATARAALQSGNSILIAQVEELMSAVDLDLVMKAGQDRADKACGASELTEERGACLKKHAMPYVAFVSGSSKAGDILERNGTNASISEFMQSYCRAHFDY